MKIIEHKVDDVIVSGLYKVIELTTAGGEFGPASLADCESRIFEIMKEFDWMLKHIEKLKPRLSIREI